MISITCKSCQKVLTIDEAFAGGVCRCDRCGTIQGVPASLKKKQRAVPQPVATEPEGSPDDGLRELGELVSSGLVGSGLRRSRLQESGVPVRPAPVCRDRGRMVPALVGGAVAAALAVLIGIVMLVMLRGDDSVSPQGPGEATVVVGGGPQFSGVGLDGGSVIYVLDRGAATAEMFDFLLQATYRSIESLGESSAFQIVFWETEDQRSWPGQGPVAATAQNLEAAQRALDDISAYGQSDARSALERAMRSEPAAIVLATGKGWDLDAQFAAMVEEVRGGRRVRIHTFSLGPNAESEGLRRVAQASGGQYRELDTARLRSFSR